MSGILGVTLIKILGVYAISILTSLVMDYTARFMIIKECGNRGFKFDFYNVKNLNNDLKTKNRVLQSNKRNNSNYTLFIPLINMLCSFVSSYQSIVEIDKKINSFVYDEIIVPMSYNEREYYNSKKSVKRLINISFASKDLTEISYNDEMGLENKIYYYAIDDNEFIISKVVGSIENKSLDEQKDTLFSLLSLTVINEEVNKVIEKYGLNEEMGNQLLNKTIEKFYEDNNNNLDYKNEIGNDNIKSKKLVRKKK